MNEFIEKLIGRLEEEKKQYHKQYVDDCIGYTTYHRYEHELDKIIEIVNELAEEYNEGWIEKLLEAKKNCSEDSDCSECPFGQIEDRCILAELQISGGNNGWIPCSSGRLPEENTDVEVTIEEIANDVGGKRYYNARSWLQDGQWVIKKNPYNPTVIAWKYPTEPYQPKGE